MTFTHTNKFPYVRAIVRINVIMNVGLAQADPYKHPFLQYQCPLATCIMSLHTEIRVTQPINAFQTPILYRQVNHMTNTVL